MIYLKWFICGLVLVDSVQSFNHSDIHSEILSRKKRFLIFPEGSSFQLVFCNTFPTIFTIGDIFLWGVTAALAWELPQDPYSPFNHKADPLHRRMDSKMISYFNEEGNVIYKRPYGIKKLIVNPAFVKRSVQTKREKYNIDRKLIHSKNSKLDGRRGFHRSTRASLYQKIEGLLQGLGGNGRECLLRTLCIVGKTPDDSQGSFFQEILRATFTLPKALPGDDAEEDLNDYDKACAAEEPCHELYPDCNDPLTGPAMY